MAIRSFKARSLVVAGIAIATVVLILSLVPYYTRRVERVSLPSGVIRVEVAATEDRRARGLSNRETMRDPLLLDWNAAGRHPIWMKDMRFALDLVWINGTGQVLAVLANVPPCVQEPCRLHEPPGTERSHAVLELRAGDAAKYGLTAGAVIRRKRV